MERRVRDLALFNLAIDSKLRGCDLVALKVDDIAPSGYAADRASIRQKKTGRPVKFELTEATRQAVDDYVRAAGKKLGEFLFTGRGGPARSLTTRQYARLLGEWIASIGLDPRLFGTHSLRAHQFVGRGEQRSLWRRRRRWSDALDAQGRLHHDIGRMGRARPKERRRDLDNQGPDW
jgi:integrase